MTNIERSGTTQVAHNQVVVLQAILDGKPIECRPKGGIWITCGHVSSGLLWELFDYRVKQSPIAAGNNPDGLSEEQVEVKDGWRLLTEKEILETKEHRNRRFPTGTLQAWDRDFARFGTGAYTGNSISMTYRIRGCNKSTAWTFDSAPKTNVLFRVKNGTALLAPLGYTPQGVLLCRDIGAAAVLLPFDALSADYEYTTNGGKTFHPCHDEQI